MIIRPLQPDEMSILIDWAAAEGWNPGMHDAAAFHAADREGFLAAFVDGQPAACISVVRSGSTFGFLGFYICKPEFRGRGIGWQVWQAGMRHLAGRTVGLDGVVAQQDNYRKSGFVLAHRNQRYSGKPGIRAKPDAGLTPIVAKNMDAIIAYDANFYPATRAGFMRLWLTMPESSALACIEGGHMRGYGVIRRSRDGHKIGPLFAETPVIAERLFVSLVSSVPGETVILDPPEPNSAAVAMAQRYGLVPVFETARMYAGPAPELPLDRIFGITSFELG